MTNDRKILMNATEVMKYTRITDELRIERPLDDIIEFFKHIYQNECFISEILPVKESDSSTSPRFMVYPETINGLHGIDRNNLKFIKKLSKENRNIVGIKDVDYVLSNILRNFINSYDKYDNSFREFVQFKNDKCRIEAADLETFRKYKFFNNLTELGKYVALNCFEETERNSLMSYYTDFERLGGDFVDFGNAEEIDGVYVLLK